MEASGNEHSPPPELGATFFLKQGHAKAMCPVSEKIGAVTFHYHMRADRFSYGREDPMGTLQVLKEGERGERVVWEMSGRQGNAWHEATVAFHDGGTSTVTFKGTRGAGYRSDIALDSIVFECAPAAGAVEHHPLEADLHRLIDLNRDGHVTLSELLRAVDVRERTDDECILSQLHAAHHSGDDVIDLEEWLDMIHTPKDEGHTISFEVPVVAGCEMVGLRRRLKYDPPTSTPTRLHLKAEVLHGMHEDLCNAVSPEQLGKAEVQMAIDRE